MSPKEGAGMITIENRATLGLVIRDEGLAEREKMDLFFNIFLLLYEFDVDSFKRAYPGLSEHASLFVNISMDPEVSRLYHEAYNLSCDCNDKKEFSPVPLWNFKYREKVIAFHDKVKALGLAVLALVGAHPEW